MGRKKQTSGASDSPGQHIMPIRGRYYFKVRWPTDIRRRHPELPEFFERSLKTKDPRAALEAAAPLMVEFSRKCRECRAPLPQERVQEWVATLPPEGQRELMALVERRLGREREQILPAGAPAELYNDKEEGPNWCVPLPDPSGNPFLGEWTIPEKDIPSTPERSLERLLQNIEALASELAEAVGADVAKPASTDARRRKWSQLRDKEVIVAKLEESLSALKRVGFPTAAIPESAVALAAELGGKADALLSAEKLLDAWAAETLPSAATRKKYGSIFRRLNQFLGFDDVRRITVEDVARFKAARLAKGISPGTVADDVLGAGAVYAWAAKNRLLPENPFAGLAPRATRQGPEPRTPFDDADSIKLLTAARSESGWLRWLPWLLCFTGARISELVELRRGDVRREDGVWIFDLKPNETRQGKNATFQRMLPLHPALIEEGFLDYVASLPAAPTGPLFPSIPPDPAGSRISPATTRHGEWVRDKVGIKDPNKAPAHSWRHRMEDELRKARAPAEVRAAETKSLT